MTNSHRRVRLTVSAFGAALGFFLSLAVVHAAPTDYASCYAVPPDPSGRVGNCVDVCPDPTFGGTKIGTCGGKTVCCLYNPKDPDAICGSKGGTCHDYIPPGGCASDEDSTGLSCSGGKACCRKKPVTPAADITACTDAGGTCSPTCPSTSDTLTPTCKTTSGATWACCKPKIAAAAAAAAPSGPALPPGFLTLKLPPCISTGNCTLDNIVETGAAFANLITTLSAALFFATFVYGGSRYLLSFGRKEWVEAGKKAMIGGAIGMAIVMGAWTIVTYIVKGIGASTGV